MSFNLNVVHVAGRLTRDPQVRMVNGDRAVANFGLAINERWKSKDGEAKEQTTFLDITAWGRTAELVGQFLVKGSGAYVSGKLRTESWEKDGVKHHKLVLVADSVQFLDSKRDREGDAEPAPAAAAHAAKPAATKPKPIATTPERGFDDDAEIPF